MSSNLNAREIIAPEELAGAPLDKVVRAGFDLSWGRARAAIERGQIAVEGVVVTDPLRKLRAGTRVRLDLRAPRPKREWDLEDSAIVHFDAHLVVVEKPAGVSTIPFAPEGMRASLAASTRPSRGKRRDDTDAAEVTLDARVTAWLKRRAGRSGPPPSVGVVHRLDKETSGLIVFTRTFVAKKVLQTAFRFHHVQRRYLALVQGHPEKQTISTNLVRDRGDGVRGSVEARRGRAHPVGTEAVQPAVTHVEPLELYEHPKLGPCAFVACRLETGRTHQIRIHLSERGHPLLGERVYVRRRTPEPVPSLAPRVLLHAAELGFVHPATGREMLWVSAVPSDMAEVLAVLRQNVVSARSL